MRRWLRRAVRFVLLFVLAIVIAWEEIQWRLAAVFALIGKLPVLRDIEQAVRNLPPYGALVCFAVPILVLIPFKILALKWLATGHATFGLATIVIAKLTSTALVSRIFQLTRPALLTIPWCMWIFDQIMRWRDAAYEVWRGLPVVRWWRARWRRQREKMNFYKMQWLALRHRFVKDK